MGKKLFIGSLSWNVDDAALREAFSEFGEMDFVRVVTDRDSGRSRGFGFVNFIDDAAGDQAIEKMDGTLIDGRAIRVSEAVERENRGGGGGGHRRDFRGNNRGGDRSRGPRRDNDGYNHGGGRPETSWEKAQMLEMKQNEGGGRRDRGKNKKRYDPDEDW